VIFFIDEPAWPVQRENSREESVQEKRFIESEKIASREMGARKQYSSIRVESEPKHEVAKIENLNLEKEWPFLLWRVNNCIVTFNIRSK